MTKQKEIREVLDTLCCVAKAKDLSKSPTGFDDEVSRAMLELQELGVVIKVERELPPIAVVSGDEWSLKQCRWTQEAMLEAGFVAVESLVG